MSRTSVVGRPLFVFCSTFSISTLIFANTAVMNVLISSVVSALVLFLYVPFFARIKSKARLLPILLCSSVILSAVFAYTAVTMKISTARELDGARVTGEATVLDVEYTSGYLSSYTVRFTKSAPAVTGKVSVTLEDGSAARGDVFSGSFILSTPADEEKTEYYKNGIFLTAEAEEVKYAGNVGKFTFTSFFKGINEKLSLYLKGSHGKGELASAVLLGDRTGLDAAVKRDFSRLGTYHLLALSGLHLSVLVSALSGVLEKTRLKARTRNTVKITSIVLYMALTGFSVSVVRAGIMHTVAILAGSLNRDSDSLTSLSAAAVFILITDPFSVFDAGLLLSVLAAYGCITMAMLKRSNRRPSAPIVIRLLRYACDIFVLTLFISLITLPVTWLVFGEISLISPIVNVLFIPAVTLLLVLSATALIFSGIPIISDLFLSVLYLTESVIIKTASALSYLPGITATLQHTGTGTFIILLFISLLPVALAGVKTRKYLTLAASVCVLVIIITSVVGSVLWSGSCDVQYTVSGKSDAIIVRDGNNYTVIDVSDGTHGMAYAVTDAVRKNKGCEIDTLILTHYDTGHISTLPYMADRMIVRRVLLPEAVNEDELDVYERLTESLAERHVDVTVYERDIGENYSHGHLHLDFSPVHYYKNSSHPIITLSFTLGGVKYAYGGRALSYGEMEFIEKAENADLLIVGAHPPKGDGFFFPYVTGKVVVPKKILTDEFKLKLDDASHITEVENKKVYKTETYTPKN